jgi:hypothetical protein
MSKNIYRQKRKSNYTIVPNEMLNNKELSWKAKGMLAYLLSLPDTWEVYAAHLRTVSVDGNDSTVSGLNELMELKYVWRKPRSGTDPGGWEYLVFDEPQLDDPFRDGDSPTRENPDSGKPATSKETEEQVSKQSSVRKTAVKLVDDSFISKLKTLNPELDIDAEFRKMDNWLLSHPNRPKSQAFAANWINRAAERYAEKNPKPQKAPDEKTDPVAAGLYWANVKPNE